MRGQKTQLRCHGYALIAANRAVICASALLNGKLFYNSKIRHIYEKAHEMKVSEKTVVKVIPAGFSPERRSAVDSVISVRTQLMSRVSDLIPKR